MPRRSYRRAQAENLVKAYTKIRKSRASSQAKKVLARRQEIYALRRAGLHPQPRRSTSSSSDSSTSSSSDFDSDTSQSDVSTDFDYWSDILGHGWQKYRGTVSPGHDTSSEEFSSASSLSEYLHSSVHQWAIPMSSDSSTSISDDNADQETDSEDEGYDPINVEVANIAHEYTSTLSAHILHAIEDMYRHRYTVPCQRLARGPSRLVFTLTELKHNQPQHFRQELRINPTTFDLLVSSIENDVVFSNNSQNAQIPVEIQVAITLWRLGHNGNAASLQSAASWAGVGKGTVSLCTKRVMAALLQPESSGKPSQPESMLKSFRYFTQLSVDHSIIIVLIL
ncbi:hypothetical protein PUNSTDRAFT_44660 [Punctularia strigosozonata HHB-11173 SS5]|uniref:uncharacterized protein n=1 Tax=Punctularia strigosozonata (strain HHB-11173) TaxID=741275 RepID=UPI0004416A07|nr:uncharacterized protein PUNSTDRAFT_44660 [Punctularia strigosozonata HHB-11173 SS5]EIN09276.1 hypothetical protein PUNSTDRAFT_44660 [Punctularia strigosozonata HHB-11173 SS5]